MKTDELIDVLGTNLRPADRGQVGRALAGALIFGAAAVLGGMLAVLGLRADLFNGSNLGVVVVKLTFTLGLLGLATVALVKLMSPGGGRRGLFILVSLPFIAIAICGAFALAFTHWTNWGGMIVGRQWLICIAFIPLFAIVPFAAIVWILRRTAAPTDLTRAGAMAGLVAGSLSATAYALHCPDDSLPFVAVWYGGAIAVCTLLGGRLGPWLLRW
jgi:hypothetical protein